MRSPRVVFAIIGLLLASVVALAWVLLFVPEAKLEEHRTGAIAYIGKGQYKEAVIELKNVIQIDPTDADGHYRLALTYLKLGGMTNIKAAYGELTKTVDLDGSNRDAQLKLGELELVSQQPAKAGERAEAVLASAPQDIQGLILRGQSLISQKNFYQGIADLKRAIELDPKKIQPYITLADAYLNMKNAPAAEAALGQGQKANPQSPHVRVAMGNFWYVTGKPDKAEAEYRRALELAVDQDAFHLQLAGFYQATRQWEQAEAAYQRFAATKPQDEHPHIALGDFYLSTGRPEKALASYQRAVGLNPSSAAARDKVIDYYLNTGQWEEAERRIHPILDKNPGDLAGRVFDARLSLGHGETDRAIELLQAIRREQPHFASAHHLLGLASIQKNDLAQARRELTEAIKLAPSSGEARSALAALYLVEGSYDLAIEQARAALRINGRDLQA